MNAGKSTGRDFLYIKSVVLQYLSHTAKLSALVLFAEEDAAPRLSVWKFGGKRRRLARIAHARG